MFRELETRDCRDDEFNSTDFEENYTFYPPTRSAESDIKIYGPKMKCLENTDDVKLWGNYDSTTARNIMVVFERCNATTNKDGCKSEQEIDDWMSFKYILTYVNEKKFV